MNAVRNLRRTQCQKKSFWKCGSLLRRLVTIRLGSLQWRKGRTRGHTGSLNPESTNISNRTASHPKSTNRSNSEVVHKHGYPRKTRSCMQEHRRAYEAMDSWDKVAHGPRIPPQMTPQQKHTQFGNQWNVVQTAAGGSNTIPTRQHPKLGQAHRARMDKQSGQRVTADQAGTSSTQAQRPRQILLLFRTR